MRKLVIYGASFLDCVKLVQAINDVRPSWSIAGFLDDTPELQNAMRLGYPVLGGGERLAGLAADPEVDFFDNVRGHWGRCHLIAERLRAVGRASVTLVHPSVDRRYVDFGVGCAVSDGTVIAAMTKLGEYVTVRLGCRISHDVAIGDYVALGPGVTVGSHVRIGPRASIGAGATIVTGIEIGADSIIAAGALVTKPVAAGVQVAGAPARLVPGTSAR